MSTLEPPRGLLAGSYSPTFGIAYRGQLFAQRKEQVEKYVPDDADYAVGFAGAMGKATAGPACPMELVISGPGASEGAALLGEALGARVHLARPQLLEGDNLWNVLSLLDLKYIAGKSGILEILKREYLSQWRLRANQVIPKLIDEAMERWDKLGQLAHLSEPDILRARGGLADLRLLDCVESSWLAAANRAGLDRAGSLLRDVRDCVEHFSSTQVLRIEQQDLVADYMGTTARQLRATIAQASIEIENATARLLDRAEAVARGPKKTLPRVVRGIRKAPALQIIDKSVALHSGQVVLSSKRDLADPHLVLRLARAAGRRQTYLGAWTVSALRGAKMPSEWDDTARQLLIDFLVSAGFRQIFGQLDRVGIPSRIFPLWEQVRSKPVKGQRLTKDYFLVELTYFACGLASRRITSVVPARPMAPHPAPGVVALAAILSGFSKSQASEVLMKLGVDSEWRSDILKSIELGEVLLQAVSSDASMRAVDEVNEAIGGSKHLLSLLAVLAEAYLLAVGAPRGQLSALADLVYMVDETQVLADPPDFTR